MVLQEAYDGSAQDADTGYSSPPDDYDSNGSSMSGDRTTIADGGSSFQIDFTKLSKPYGLIAKVDWKDSHFHVSRLTSTLRSSERLMARPLRQEEVDAIAERFAKATSTATSATPWSFVAAGLMTSRNRDKWRVPFYNLTDAKWFNPDKFGMVTGRSARILWTVARAAAYQIAAIFTLRPILTSQANTVAVVEASKDPRLKDVNEAMQKSLKEKLEQMSRPPSQKSPVESTGGRMDDQAQKASTVWERARAGRQGKASPNTYGDDDMSPTGGAFMDDIQQGPGSTDGGLMSDSQMQMSERRKEFEARAADRQVEGQRQSDERRQRQEARDERVRQHREQQVTQPGSSTGSAWDRIRQNARGGNGTSDVQAEQQPGSTVGDSFAFSQGDEDRQLAQTEAQQDFDARVERERRGGDFSESTRRRNW